jgi:hypothetical protein
VSLPSNADRAFGRLRLPGTPPPAASDKRFPDGALFRVEIPSVESPRVLEAVLDAAREHDVVVNRVSQGSGAMLLKEVELRDMAALGAEAGLEVSLFVGPREGFDVGAHARSADGAAHFGQLRGTRQLAYAVEDVARAVEAGIRSFLIADIGLLSVVVDMQGAGELPAECVWKISVLMAPSNAASLRVLEELGATTVNIASDVTLPQLAELRAGSQLPIDLYVEWPSSSQPGRPSTRNSGYGTLDRSIRPETTSSPRQRRSGARRYGEPPSRSNGSNVSARAFVSRARTQRDLASR